VKGTVFAAELHILYNRMRGNLLSKARRGELALRLPVGYRRLQDGQVTLDPDEQVRRTLELLFAQFAILRSARAVQRYFDQHQLKMPRLVQHGSGAGQLYWVRPTYQMIQQVLTNPAYAGAFVYGRRKREAQPGDPPLSKDRRLVQHPARDGRVIHAEAPFGHQFFQFAVTKRILQIPANTQQKHLILGY
jgi:Recombinase